MCALPGRRSWIPFLVWTSLGAVRVVCQLPLSSALLGMYASFSLISLLLSGTADLCSRVVASFLVPFWHGFGVILGVGGDLETSWGAFVPHLCPRILPSSIFSSFWAALGVPFGTIFGEVFGARPAAEPPGGHFYQFRPHVVTLLFYIDLGCQK